MNRRIVYLDSNSSTKIDKKVLDYMNKVHTHIYAVASSQFSHTPGIKAKDEIEKARGIISKKINATPEELIFTSGGTEANNLAIKGMAFSQIEGQRKKILVSKIEHFSVLHSVRFLRKFGFDVEFINVDNEGFLDIDHLFSLIDDNTLLVSVMYANNEVGTIQDIKEIAKIVHRRGAYFHTDAASAFLQIPINVEDLEVDLLTISAHKIYGPKGVGALYIKKGTQIEKIIDGGYQEYNLRGGTENIPGIAGFGKAVELFKKEDNLHAKNMRDYLFNRLTHDIENLFLNGPLDFEKRISNNLNISFEYIEGESVVLHLDTRGIAVTTGSACFSRSLEASHVLLAMGFTHERAHGSIRFSTDKYITKEDVEYTVYHVKEVVDNLRKLSPLL